MPGEVSVPREDTGATTGALFPESGAAGTPRLALGISVNTGRRLGHEPDDSAQEREFEAPVNRPPDSVGGLRCPDLMAWACSTP